MSIPLMRAVLASPLGKSSSRFALTLLAFHACSTCERVFISAATLAKEMNNDVRKAQALLSKLRADGHLLPTGEHGPKGVIVYRLSVTTISSGDEIIRDQMVAPGTTKKSRRCRFCTTKTAYNRQVIYKQEIDKGSRSLARDGEDEAPDPSVPKQCSAEDCPVPVGQYSAYKCDHHALLSAREAVKAGPSHENYARGCAILRQAGERPAT